MFLGKKCIWIIMVLIFIVTGLSSQVLAEVIPGNSDEVLFSYNCQNQADGSLPLFGSSAEQWTENWLNKGKFSIALDSKNSANKVFQVKYDDSYYNTVPEVATAWPVIRKTMNLSGKVSINYKFMSNYDYVDINYLTQSIGIEFKKPNTTATKTVSLFSVQNGKFNNGLGGALQENAVDKKLSKDQWYDINLLFDTATKTVDYYINGKPLKLGLLLFTDEVLLSSATLVFTHSAMKDLNKRIYFDDVYVRVMGTALNYTIENLNTVDRREMNLVFNRNLNAESLLPSNVKIVNSETNIEAISSTLQYNTAEPNKCKIIFDQPLKALAQYKVLLPGVKDVVGLTTVDEVSFKTRDEILVLNPIKFYSTDSGNEISTMQDGHIKASFVIVNELDAPYEVEVIMALFNRNKLIQASKRSASVVKDSTVALEPNVAFLLPNGSSINDYHIQLFQWNKMQDMKILRPVAVLGTGETASNIGTVSNEQIGVIIDTNYGSRMVTINGNLGKNEASRIVSLQVTKENLDFSNVPDEIPASDLYYITEVQTDANGAFSKIFEMPDITDHCQVIVGGAGTTSKTVFKCYSNSDLGPILNEINHTTDSSVMKNIIDGDGYNLKSSLDYTQAYRGLSDAAKLIVSSTLIENKPYSSIDEFRKMVVIFSGIGAIKQLQSSTSDSTYYQTMEMLISTYFEQTKNLTTRLELKINDNRYKLYKNKDDQGAYYFNDLKDIFDEQVRNSFYDKLKVGTFETIEQFKTTFEKGIVLTAIRNTNIYSDSIRILQLNNDMLGLDFTDYNNLSEESKVLVNKALGGVEFSDISKLKEEFYKRVAQYKIGIQPDPEPRSPSGGGGKSYSVTPVTVIPTPPPVEAPKEIFEDLSEVLWAKESINSLAEKGIITGVSDKTYAPLNKVTRAQFLKILIEGLNIVDSRAVCNFEDVNENDWYYKYIATAQDLGITSGKSENSFGVNEEISRQDIAVFCYRALEAIDITLNNETNLTYEDQEQISDYAKEAIAIMSKAGIIMGDNQKFAPLESANRAQAAKIIYELLKNTEATNQMGGN